MPFPFYRVLSSPHILSIYFGLSPFFFCFFSVLAFVTRRTVANANKLEARAQCPSVRLGVRPALFRYANKCIPHTHTHIYIDTHIYMYTRTTNN